MPKARRQPSLPDPFLDRGADGPAQPRRRLVEIADPRRDPRTGARRAGRVQVMARSLSPAIRAFPAHLRIAAETYAQALEEVEAGGASTPAGDTPPGPRGAGGEAPSRQFMALAAVTRLRALEEAIGEASLIERTRAGGVAAIESRALLRAVAADALSLREICRRRGLRRTPEREARLSNAVREGLERVAEAAGLKNGGRGA